jgi:hypothetical protein
MGKEIMTHPVNRKISDQWHAPAIQSNHGHDPPTLLLPQMRSGDRPHHASTEPYPQ